MNRFAEFGSNQEIGFLLLLMPISYVNFIHTHTNTQIQVGTYIRICTYIYMELLLKSIVLME